MLSAAHMTAPRAEPAHCASSLAQMIAASPGFTARAGDRIYDEGEEAAFVYRVSTGCVRSLTLDRDGRRTIHAFHLPGDIFGAERDGSHVCTAQAVCDSRLTRCEQARLPALAQTDPAAAGELWAWLLLTRDQAAERSGRLARGSAFDKLIYFLMDMAWRASGGGRVELPMSRYDIADYLGLSSETVSRTFTTLRRRGLISLEGRTVLLAEARRHGRRHEAAEGGWAEAAGA